MDAYLEMSVRPDPEFSRQVLLDALYSKLHRALARGGVEDVGVSFPAHGHKPRTLGARMRLHGTEDRLAELMGGTWLGGMTDHLHVGSIQPVPYDARHRVVRRVQPKTNVARLRRRYCRRHNVSEEEARRQLPDSIEKAVSLPFVTLRSATTEQRFALFVEHGPLRDDAVPGLFSAYGLSPIATVPWF
ncbi:MAG: type I-F CRISPR-associated endoribonuclease Cas6/Csy4 [Alcanivorax sp.]